MLDIGKVTNEYYSQFLGIDEIVLNNRVNTVFYKERDIILKGYSYSMDICVLVIDETIYISYGTKAKDIIGELTAQLQNKKDAEEVKNTLEKISGSKVKHSIKYIYKNIVDTKSGAVKLDKDHYHLFLKFFKENNPDVKDCSWLEEYFLELAKKGFCYGVIIDGKLVSAADAPSMPYMAESVQEIGIYTLKDYQGRGYASMACAAMIKYLLSKNICPLWSVDIKNIASDRLAVKTGFEKYCDVLTVDIKV